MKQKRPDFKCEKKKKKKKKKTDFTCLKKIK